MNSDLAQIDEMDLPRLAEHGLVNDGSYLPALDLFRDSSFWNSWAINALFALSVGHILAGIIFFFAHNWFGLPDLAKFGVVGGGITLSVLGWLALRLDGRVAQALGISATVLVGVMFAVFGQVYQTPALIHTPFVLWAFMTLPFAVMSRNLAHWTVWLVIAAVAVFAYAATGLTIIGNHLGAELLIIGAGAMALFALAAYDYFLARKQTGTRVEWFRVFLIALIGVFLVTGFVISFWRSGGGVHKVLAFGALVLSVMLLGYLYRLKPTLAGLALATFIIFIIAIQFLFRIFSIVGDVSSFLFIFLGIVGMIIGMAKAFQHFAKVSDRNMRQDNAAPEAVTADKTSPSIAVLAQVLRQDENDIQAVLSANSESHSPWYIETFLAIGGVFAAIFGCGFVGSFLGLILTQFDDYGIPLLGVGLVLFGGAMTLRMKTGNGFTRHFFNTLILVGSITAIIGFGIMLESFEGPVILAIGLSALTLFLVRDRIIEFLSALTIIGCLGFEFYYRLGWLLPETLLLLVSTVLGIFLLTRPMGRRIYNAAGTAFLIAPALLGIALVHYERLEGFLAEDILTSLTWQPRAVSLLILAGAVIWLNRANKDGVGWRPPLFILIPLVLAMALLPFGGASALLLMLAGYSLGSRSLAIVGVLFQIYFLYMFYYDLTLSLGVKSYVLLITGLVFLGVWVLANGRIKPEALL